MYDCAKTLLKKVLEQYCTLSHLFLQMVILDCTSSIKMQFFEIKSPCKGILGLFLSLVFIAFSFIAELVLFYQIIILQGLLINKKFSKCDVNRFPQLSKANETNELHMLNNNIVGFSGKKCKLSYALLMACIISLLGCSVSPFV